MRTLSVMLMYPTKTAKIERAPKPISFSMLDH
jgi:hypothetical protein